YDFTVNETNTELRVQFRRGGRHADGLNIGTPDKMSFAGTDMEPINAVESGGEFMTQLVVSGFRKLFPTTPDDGMLTLTKSGTTYYHKIEVPNIRFAKFPAEFERKKQIRLPITNAAKVGSGIWTLKLKNAIWGQIGFIWLPGTATTKDYIVGRTPADRVYFDLTSPVPAIVLDLPEFATAKPTSFYSAELSAVFPCNSTDEPAVPEKLTGIECTYQIPSSDIIFPGQTQPKGSGTPAVIPTIPPMVEPSPKSKR
ncbi:MAG: hypothetical protein ABJA02_00385, partial [Acidobacteriota bacterium]